MGWLYSPRWQNRNELVEHLRSTERFGTNLRLLKSAVVGNNHWYLYGPVADPALVIVGLDLMRGSGKRDEGWGYKDLDETVGPVEVNCPLSFLKQASEPSNEWAREWREKVRRYHAERKRKPTPVPGMRVRAGDTEYELVEKWPQPGMGWRVRRTSDGMPFRMMASQLNRLLVMQARAEAAGDAPASGMTDRTNPSARADQLELAA